MQDEDSRWMRRALSLAARGFTPPNPMVGCVLVKDGRVAGEGYHPAAGQPHAEIFALREAGEAARGATAYVSLEPCCHHGRTPPCTDALIAAKVARVVVAVLDNNPKVGGKGVEILHAAGIAVEVGVLEAEARRINEAFFHFHATGRPFVTLKAAMTLDGKIATRAGDSKWITGESARRYVHRLRAQSGAVLAGIGTVLHDDPALNARLDSVKLPRQPLRIIVDSRLRTPPQAQAVRIAAASPDFAPLLIATTENADRQNARSLEQDGVEIVKLPATPEGHVDLAALMTVLGQRQVLSVFVEGGGEIHAALLGAQLAHKILFFVAPKIVGGRDAVTPVGGAGAGTIGEAWNVTSMKVRRFGEDVALESYLRMPGIA